MRISFELGYSVLHNAQVFTVSYTNEHKQMTRYYTVPLVAYYKQENPSSGRIALDTLKELRNYFDHLIDIIEEDEEAAWEGQLNPSEWAKCRADGVV